MGQQKSQKGNIKISRETTTTKTLQQQNLWAAAEELLRGKFIAINTYIKTTGRF